MKFYLETERLILRELRESDLEGIFELDSNPLVHKYLGNNPIKTKEKAAEIIQFVQQQYKNLGIGRFAAIEKSSGDFIGWSGLKLNTGEKEALNGKTDFYDIGYRFIPRYWGKGYATESALATLNFGFKKLNIETICGAAEIENIASNKVLQKIDLKFINKFTYEDVKCNWYELNIEDYKELVLKRKRQAYYLKNKEHIKHYNAERYRINPKYKQKTLENAKRRYHEDPEYRLKTIERAKARYKNNSKQ